MSNIYAYVLLKVLLTINSTICKNLRMVYMYSLVEGI